MKTRLGIYALCTLATLAPAASFGQGLAGLGPCVAHNLPPAQRLMEPGPGVGGPGPGVLHPMAGAMAGGGVSPTMGYAPVGAGGGYSPGCLPVPGMNATSQIAFLGAEGTEVAWDISGQGLFDSVPLVMPGRQNFPQAAIYRLKLTNLPDRPGVELYPTLEVAPVTPRTDAYLAHAPIPIQITDEDLDQVLSGNFVTKVIYLPDPEFQELTIAGGVQELVSTRLDPGVDPISEADRRGSIMAILRVGNLDLQAPGNGLAMQGGVTHAHYDGQNNGTDLPDPVEYQSYESEYCGPYGNASGMGTPQGMATAGFAPQAVPPHMVSGMTTGQWGIPHVGTPIGLPGPPHIPLGHEAGLTSHSIRNRTRVRMPPPVHKMTMTVKQRPGMSYPRPVNHVDVSEVNRAGFRMFHGPTNRGDGKPSLLDRLFTKKGECPNGCPDGECVCYE